MLCMRGVGYGMGMMGVSVCVWGGGGGEEGGGETTTWSLKHKINGLQI